MAEVEGWEGHYPQAGMAAGRRPEGQRGMVGAGLMRRSQSNGAGGKESQERGQSDTEAVGVTEKVLRGEM
jgi:hypothetical protein